jgi:beta-glucanase (GH16 family)
MLPGIAVVVAVVLAVTTMTHGSAAADAAYDDFDGPAGAAPNGALWNYDVGDTGWGNGEQQAYTRDTANARLDGAGNLLIQARRDGNHVTSARLTTKDRFAFTHGRAEARIKLPRGAGLHPAFWLLGTDNDAVGWPASGEIDVMETVSEPTFVHNGAIGPDADGTAYKLEGSKTIDPSFVDDFHTYWVQRDPGRITYGVDDETTTVFTADQLKPGQRWVFDKPFYLLLNVAVGGDWPGPIGPDTVFPATMTVDWVKVSGN